MKNRSLLLIVLGAVAGIVLLTGCGDSSPEAVVQNWHSAICKGDAKAAAKYVAASGAEWNSFFIAAQEKMDKDKLESWKKFKVGKAVVNGDTATVVAPPAMFEDGVKLVLKKIDGKWKIDFNAGKE